MDFGFMSLESLVGPTEPTSSLAEEASEAKPKPKPKPKLGSGFLKKERSGPEKQQRDDDGDDGNGEEEEEEGNNGDGDSSYRASKMAKTMASRSSSLFLGGEAIMARQKQEQVLISFSADHSKSEVCFLGKDGDGTVMERSGQTAQTQSLAFPYSQRMASSYNPRNTVSGYGSGSLNQTMHVGLRGPFTPSQWIELEHQALIYKYITANVPVPSNLLLPIKKSLNPFAFPPLLSSLPANSFGWGGFHLGFADNSDPEPGRCRRTDGKKWRCSRDAVADQKYCERHINRGRHRSRKPVEAGQQQTGQAASAATAAAAAATSKAMPLAASAMPGCGGGAGGGGGPSSGLAAFKGGPDPALANRMQDLRGALSVMSSCSAAVNLKPGESTFVVPKQEIVVPPEAATSQSVFGLVSTDSLLNPTSYITSKSYASSFLDFGGQGSQDHQNHPLRHFIDDWPKDESSRPVIAWPEEIKPEWTQLSMSIPMTSSDFSSSSNSPKQEKLALSPLRLSREFERPPPPMPTTNLNLSQKQQQQAANWVPISWGSSNCTMGGPLGEVLTNTSSSLGNPKQHCRNPSSSLNLLTEGWDGSPQLGSSPTGVLQKSTFCSLSNSSSGSSPRADNNNNNNGKKSNNADDRKSAYEEAIGSTLASSSVPSL